MATVLLLLTCLLVLGSSLFGCVPDAEAAVNNANQNRSPLNVNSWHDRQRRLVNGSRTGDTTPEEVWYSFMKNGRVLSRGEREAKHVDYDGNHPFERTAWRNGEDVDGTRRRIQRNPQTAYTDGLAYKPMRIQFDTHLLDSLSTSHPSHVSYVRNVLLPSLRNFWAETLKVVPARSIEVPLRSGQCAQEVKKLSGLNLGDYLSFDTSANARTASNIGSNVVVSSDGSNLIYNEKDLVVIILPVEGTDLCPEKADDDGPLSSSQLQTLAFATNCQNDQLDRPTVGYAGICFAPLNTNDRSTKTHQRRLLTIAHEITHILGVNSYDFPYFYSHETGQPRTPRNQWNRPSTESVLCVDGTRQTVEIPSEDTLRPITTANGYIAYEIVTETVRNVVRNQFDCQTVVGGRLENQPTGDSDCFGSHWDHRLFNNEFMAAVYTGSTQYVTALTLALLEDSGWYKPNYLVAQTSPFALGAGCDFAKDECVGDNGFVPAWARGTYCDSAASIGCTPDKHLVAYCDISKWDGNLPSGYQYFEDPSVGGGLQQMDFCPAYTTIFRFEVDSEVRVLDCTDSTLNGAWVQKKDEVFGGNSRCIEHASGSRPLCLEVICGTNGRDTGKVIFDVNGRRLRCRYSGEVLKLPSGTEVICPSFEQTCPESMCPGNCSGRGRCDYSLSPPQCECFNRQDTSPLCLESPWSFAPTFSPVPTTSSRPTTSPTFTPMPSESFARSSASFGSQVVYAILVSLLAVVIIII